jgi:hypothetical protein
MPVEPGRVLRLNRHHSCFAPQSPRLLARPNAPAGQVCSGARRSLDWHLRHLPMPMRRCFQTNGRPNPPPIGCRERLGPPRCGIAGSSAARLTRAWEKK